MWKNNKNKIIKEIEKKYPNYITNDSLNLSVNILEPMYSSIKEFLFLCIPRPTGDVLKDAFSSHVIMKSFIESNTNTAHYNEELKSLYFNNIIKQLEMFIRAIGLVNSSVNENIIRANGAIKLIGNTDTKDNKFVFIGIYLITAIQIIVDLKLKPKNLRVNLIKLMEQYNLIDSIRNTPKEELELDASIKLIQKVYSDHASEKEKKELNKMLIL